MENIIEKMQEQGNLNYFLRLIYLTNFQDILQNNGPYTVFAPTDEAFGNLPAGSYERFLANPDLAADVVGQHISIGRFWNTDLNKLDEVISIDNFSLEIGWYEDGIIIGGGKIIEQNIECENGIVHIIDLVLLP